MPKKLRQKSKYLENQKSSYDEIKSILHHFWRPIIEANKSSTIKSSGLPKKISSCEVSALKLNKTVQHDTNVVLDGFKDYYSNLAVNLLKKLTKPPNKFTLNTVFQDYKCIIQSHSFNLATVS